MQQIDPIGKTQARTQRISQLESERQQLMLSLQGRMNVRSPNEAQVNSLQTQISNIEALIRDLRNQMTNSGVAEHRTALGRGKLYLPDDVGPAGADTNGNRPD